MQSNVGTSQGGAHSSPTSLDLQQIELRLPASPTKESASYGEKPPNALSTAAGEPVIKHFTVEMTTPSGELLSRRCFSFDATVTDSHYLVVHRPGLNGIELGVLESQPAPLKARRLLPVNQAGESATSTIMTLPPLPPGLSRELDLDPLGEGFFPSGGSSCERVHLQAVASTTLPVSSSKLHFVAASEIIQRYQSGEVLDLKVVLAALRLSEAHSSNSHRTPNTTPNDWLVPVVSGAELAELHAKRNIAYELPIRTTVREAEAAPEKPFLTHMITPDGSKAIVLRRGFDGVDSVAYVRYGQETYMLVKRGIRPMLVAREIVAGNTDHQPCPLSIEGVAESLEGEQSLATIAERAMQGVREEGGVNPIRHQYIGAVLPLPEMHAERSDLFLIEIDPSHAVVAHYTPDERIDVFLVPVGDIISLCNQGVISDPRLELGARLLSILSC